MWREVCGEGCVARGVWRGVCGGRTVVLRVPSPKGLSSAGEVMGFSKAATHCVRCRCARIRSSAAASPPRQSTRLSSSSAAAYGPPSARRAGTAPSVAAAASPTGGKHMGRARLTMGTALISCASVAGRWVGWRGGGVAGCGAAAATRGGGTGCRG